MTNRTKWTAAIAAVAITAVVGTMTLRHIADSTANVTRADLTTTQISDAQVVKALQDANVDVDKLIVRSVGGIVILRGTGDPAAAEQAVAAVKNLGVLRVANLITPAKAIDDDSIRRDAERQLGNHGSLTGCVLRVSCERGVITVTGKVRHELQIDAARSVLRTIRGAQGVEVQLDRM